MGQRDDQRLVHEPLQRGRRVAERHAGDDVDRAVLVEIGGVRLLAQVVGDDVGPGAAARQAEVDGAVEASGPDQGRVEVVLAVGGAHDQHVGRHDGRLVQLGAVGEVAVEQVDPGPGEALAAGRGVEGLQLHEQLVDHAGHALGPAAAAHAAPGGADGVDLLDEADGAALLAGVLAQLLEEGADLAVGLPVVHRLEGRGGHEEEGDVRLLGHRLGDERLARPGRPLEEHAAAGRAAHGVAEGLVGQEEVDGAHHLGLDRVDPDEVLEAHLGLAGADERVRRAPGAEEGGQHDRPEHADDEEDGQGGAQPVREVHGGEDAVPGDPADDDPAEDECGDRHQAAQAGEAAALTGPGHVGAAEDGVAHDPRDGWSATVGLLAGTCGGRDQIGGPTHDRLRSSPEDVFPI